MSGKHPVDGSLGSNEIATQKLSHSSKSHPIELEWKPEEHRSLLLLHLCISDADWNPEVQGV